MCSLGLGTNSFVHILYNFCRRSGPSQSQVLPKTFEFILWFQVTKTQLKWNRRTGSCTSMAGGKLTSGISRTRSANTTGMLPPYSSMCLYFSFFLSNWRSSGRVCMHVLVCAHTHQWRGETGCVGSRLTFLWLSDCKGIRKLASLSSPVFKYGRNKLAGTSWVICPLLGTTTMDKGEPPKETYPGHTSNPLARGWVCYQDNADAG